MKPKSFSKLISPHLATTILILLTSADARARGFKSTTQNQGILVTRTYTCADAFHSGGENLAGGTLIHYGNSDNQGGLFVGLKCRQLDILNGAGREHFRRTGPSTYDCNWQGENSIGCRYQFAKNRVREVRWTPPATLDGLPFKVCAGDADQGKWTCRYEGTAAIPKIKLQRQ